MNASQDRLQGPFKLNFHAEVGSKYGEYRTGYDVLHGSNKSAGDLVVTGKFTSVRDGGPGDPYTVTYEQLVFVFNDIVDMDKYKADVQFGVLAANMAKSLGGLPPKDYILRIMWRGDKPWIYEFGHEVRGAPSAFLKQWNNL